MEEQHAPVERDGPSPVFAAYRRGYDPDQVDRYVAEQHMLTEVANQRADEAEQKLASAVAQMREMHKRITMLEAMDPVSPTTQPVQAIPVDTLGVHVQRILSEAWEGSHALTQEAEQAAVDIKEKALAEGDRIVAQAKRKAESVGEELARRRQTYLERLEAERSKAVSQMTFLQEQRELAISDLHRVKSLVDATIAEVSISGGQPARPVEREAEQEAPMPAAARTAAPAPAPMTTPRVAPATPRPEPVLSATMPVHRIAASEPMDVPDASELVRSHRARPEGAGGVIRSLPTRPGSPAGRPSFFDFDEQEDDE